jgi:hypothetical protein
LASVTSKSFMTQVATAFRPVDGELHLLRSSLSAGCRHQLYGGGLRLFDLREQGSHYLFDALLAHLVGTAASKLFHTPVGVDDMARPGSPESGHPASTGSRPPGAGFAPVGCISLRW